MEWASTIGVVSNEQNGGHRDLSHTSYMGVTLCLVRYADLGATIGMARTFDTGVTGALAHIGDLGVT